MCDTNTISYLISHTSQEIGWEEHLQYDLLSVEWDIKPQLSQPLTWAEQNTVIIIIVNVVVSFLPPNCKQPNNRTKCPPTEWTECLHDAGRDVLVKEVSHEAPDRLAVPDLAGYYQPSSRGGHATDAVAVNDVEVVAVRQFSADALGVYQVKFTWSTFRMHHLHRCNIRTTFIYWYLALPLLLYCCMLQWQPIQDL